MLGTSLLWVMVAVAFEKQMTSPDLGCDLYTTEADCLVMMQPFDDQTHACSWDPTLMVPCENVEPDPDATFTPFGMVMLIACMLVIDPFIMAIEVRQAVGLSSKRERDARSIGAQTQRKRRDTVVVWHRWP